MTHAQDLDECSDYTMDDETRWFETKPIQHPIIKLAIAGIVIAAIYFIATR
jgi:hypothetical protein